MSSAAAVGWIVLFAAPPVVAAYVAVTSEMRDKQLKARQKNLISHWGRNVRLGVMGAELEDEDAEEELPAGESDDKEAAAEAAPSS